MHICVKNTFVWKSRLLEHLTTKFHFFSFAFSFSFASKHNLENLDKNDERRKFHDHIIKLEKLIKLQNSNPTRVFISTMRVFKGSLYRVRCSHSFFHCTYFYLQCCITPRCIQTVPVKWSRQTRCYSKLCLAWPGTTHRGDKIQAWLHPLEDCTTLCSEVCTCGHV